MNNLIEFPSSIFNYDNFENYFSIDMDTVKSYSALFEPLLPSGERISLLSEKTGRYMAFKFNPVFNMNSAWGYGVDVPYMTKNKDVSWVKPGSWKAGLVLRIYDARNVLANTPTHLFDEIARRRALWESQFPNTGA